MSDSVRPVRKQLNAIWCDDVRFEIGNKISLIGIYQGQLLLPAIPSVIPQLCVALTALSPKRAPFAYLKFRVLRNFEEMAEQVIEVPPPPPDMPELGYGTFSTVMFFRNIEVKEPFVLRARAEVAEGVLIGAQPLEIGVVPEGQGVQTSLFAANRVPSLT